MTQLVGILNLTPDSFSDGGNYFSPEAALAHAEALQEAGAAVIDIGAESTRPGATPLSPEQEWARLGPVIAPLLKAGGIAVSVDTRHAETAKRALDLGTAWINDVSGGDCAAVVRGYPQARYVLMHSLSVPANPSLTLPETADPVEALLAFFVTRLAELDLPREQIILDPGIGFGKTAAQSLQLIRRAGELKILGLPVLFGHSRKSCFASVAPKADDREGATLAASLHLRRQGIDYLRVHEVALHAQAFRVDKMLE